MIPEFYPFRRQLKRSPTFYPSTLSAGVAMATLSSDKAGAPQCSSRMDICRTMTLSKVPPKVETSNETAHVHRDGRGRVMTATSAKDLSVSISKCHSGHEQLLSATVQVESPRPVDVTWFLIMSERLRTKWETASANTSRDAYVNSRASGRLKAAPTPIIE